MALRLTRKIGNYIYFVHKKTGNEIHLKVIKINYGRFVHVLINSKPYTFYNQDTKSGYSAPLNFDLDKSPISITARAFSRTASFSINAPKATIDIERDDMHENRDSGATI